MVSDHIMILYLRNLRFMRILFIADGHPREWPILHILGDRYPETVWVQPTYHNFTETGKSSNNIPHLYSRIRNRIHRIIMARKAGMRSFNFHHHLRISHAMLDDKRGVRLLENYKPEIILACRAPILKPNILDRASLCCINIHFGLLPDYRGNDGLFWAIYNGDTDSLGGTIHLMDDGMDTGNKLGDVFPALDKHSYLSDTEVAISRLLGKALVHILDRISYMDSPPSGKSQWSGGRNYRSDERTLTKDIGYLIRRWKGLASQKERITYYL